MKKVLFFLLSFCVGIFLFAWVIRFVGWTEIKSAFEAFSGWEGLIILGLTFAIIIAASWRWRVVLKSQGYQVSVLNLLGPYFASHSINYLAPTIPFSGEIFRGYALKEKLNLPWKIAVSSAIIDRILEVTSHLLVIIIGVVYFLFKIGLPPRNLIVILGGGLFIAASLLFFLYFKSFKKESLVKFFLKKEKRNHLFEIEKDIFNFLTLKKYFFGKG